MADQKSLNENSSQIRPRHNRIFVLDTNVLLHDVNSLFAFRGVVVGIPFVVLEELDKFKGDAGEKGKIARHVIRNLDNLRSQGSLEEGVELNHKTGSLLKIFSTPHDLKAEDLPHEKVDNIILQTVRDLVEQGYEVTFVTKDINARVKADALGLDAEDYAKEKVPTDEEFHKGWIEISMPANDLRKISASKISGIIPQDQTLFINNFVILESENNPENYRLFRFLGGTNFKEVENFTLMQYFEAKNVQQLMALDLLMDPDVQIVTLLGQAGTGKTFLTLLAGLQQILYGKEYQKFLITRPVIALGADIGYLPGGVQEKLYYWMQPIYDNLDLIFSKKHLHDEQGETEQNYENKKKKHKHESPKKKFSIDQLIRRDLLSLEAITYMRGRSIPDQFVFIDEVQNLSPHEVKTIVSRAGEGTKVILAGDPYQIDSPYLDFCSNGLTLSTDKLKGQAIFGTVFLQTSERSPLAKLAAEVL
ncbi:MAG: PhoH family protein [bacterium]